MIKKISFLTAVLSLAVWVSPSTAARPATLNLPETASQVAEDVYYLGKAQDAASGLEVEGYAIVHRTNKAKGGNGAKPNKPGGGETCYGFIAKGAYWKTNESWVMNAGNPDGLNGNTLLGLTSSSIQTWEDAVGQNIFGNGALTTNNLLASYGTLNGSNEVYFGSLDSGTIAVTIVWGYFSGPTFARELVEWDQVYNTYYSWSADDNGVANKMDYANIATHELGHAFGLADMYSSGCTTVTMYGYASYAETNKRSLEPADIAGINALY